LLFSNLYIIRYLWHNNKRKEEVNRIMEVLSVQGVLDKRRREMNREDLVKLVSEKTGITKKAAEEAQKAVIEGFSSALEKGESISIVGFGSFKVVDRAAREGRNPSTGEKMQIPASKAVKFTPSKALKERVQ
jgi:DNA-binding protein HU-beta